MFKKLLSNLPFNPSLVEQVAFYAKRLHREAYIRTIGIVILILAVGVQMFATVSPPQAAAAPNDNDLLRGGFTSQAEAVNRCNANEQDYRAILAPYSIGCDSLAGARTVTIRSTDYNRQLYSMGRNPYGKAGEQAVTIEGHTYYMRFLWSWDNGYSSTYKALAGTSLTGVPFFILYDCGNLVMINQPQPLPKPTPPPAPPAPPPDQCPNLPDYQSSQAQCDICPNIPGTQSAGVCLPCKRSSGFEDIKGCLVYRKSAKNVTQKIRDANKTTAKPGDVIEYTLYVQNNAVLDLKNFVVKESLSDVLEYATVSDLHGGTLAKDNTVSWPPLTVKAKATITKKITVVVKNPLPNTPRAKSNPGSHDLLMTNVYGNTINIKLPNSPVKATEQTTQTLPNTGPGAGLIIGFGVATAVGYFVARTRLMAKELDIAKRDAVSIGGQ